MRVCVYVHMRPQVCVFSGYQHVAVVQSVAPRVLILLHAPWRVFLLRAVCAFPYILAFTTDSIEIRLVVNGNLVYTAVVPELTLTASRVRGVTDD